MNIRRFLKWSLVLMAFLAYKEMQGESTEASKPEMVYMAHHENT